MLARLPLLYAALILAEVLGLTWIYAFDPPTSSSALSVALGWGGLASMVVMLVYSIARRSRALRQAARLSHWLHLHIFLGVQGVVFIFFHCYHLLFREGSAFLLNPGVLAFLLMVAVFCSGLFGRYLYAQLPRAIGGEQLAMSEVERELSHLSQPLPPEVRALWADARSAEGLFGLARADLATRRALRRLRAMDLPDDARALARRRLILERRGAVFVQANRIFRYWILLHRPLAGAMYALALAHAALSYMFSPGLAQ